MEPSVKKANIEVEKRECEIESTEVQSHKSIDSILTYDILRIIFKYLGAKDLINVAKICRFWREAADQEIALRRAPEFILKNFQIVDVKETVDSYSPELLGNDLRAKPSLGFICEKIQEEEEWTPKGCYCQNLPSSCSAVILGGYEIISDDTKVENKLGMASCAFIPGILGLNHQMFHVDKYTFKGVSNIDISAHAKNLVTQMLPSDSELSKCIIMLTNQEGYQFNKLIMKHLQKRYKPGSIALWGGVCVDLKLCEASNSSRTCSQTVRWTAITLSSPSLQSWSVLVPRSYRNEEQIEKKLNTLRESIQLKKHSIGFMFACCERIQLKDLEVKVFKKIFPKIPLIGLHGDGEYGLNTLNSKREDQLQHAYTTIFMILTYQ